MGTVLVKNNNRNSNHQTHDVFTYGYLVPYCNNTNGNPCSIKDTSLAIAYPEIYLFNPDIGNRIYSSKNKIVSFGVLDSLENEVFFAEDAVGEMKDIKEYFEGIKVEKI